MARIAAPDAAGSRAYFAAQAPGFSQSYATLPGPGRVEGRVLRFDQPPGDFPPAYYWALEAAIERQGRSWERGICFYVPYAIATWPDGDGIELLAMNHWRDEIAAPIRLLYPAESAPLPEGNECSLRVRLPVNQAQTIIQSLIDACNQG